MSREIDALVAEKVMGWRAWQSKHGYWYLEGPEGERFSDMDRRDYTAKYDKETGEKLQEEPWWTHFWDELPAYSTDITAAWGVVEKITTDFSGSSSQGFGIGIKMEYRTEAAEERCQVELVETSCAPPYEEMRELCSVQADTVPMAICLAALKAKGIEVST